MIVGGGGHGLATAYYLAKEHGITNVAVLEKGWLGCGNVGRNTTIIRSNYLLPGNIPFYEWSMKLWEGLEQDLNYNAMVSQRGVAQPLSFRRASATPLPGAAMRCACTASMPNLLDRERRARACCPSSISTTRAFRSRAGCCRGAAARRGTTPSPGAMRAAPSDRGVDIIQNCEVTGFRIEDGRGHRRRDHARLHPRQEGRASPSPAIPRASRAMAGLRLPIESHVLQAFVSEGMKPLIPSVITFGAGHFYISQSDKGGLVFGGDIDGYNSYAQRGNLPMVEDVCEGGMALMPLPRPRCACCAAGAASWT